MNEQILRLLQKHRLKLPSDSVCTHANLVINCRLLAEMRRVREEKRLYTRLADMHEHILRSYANRIIATGYGILQGRMLDERTD